MKCHDCDVDEGEFHIPGCDMEVCPFCELQLIGCDCYIQQVFGVESSEDLPQEMYARIEFGSGMVGEEIERWDIILKEKGLIPYSDGDSWRRSRKVYSWIDYREQDIDTTRKLKKSIEDVFLGIRPFELDYINSWVRWLIDIYHLNILDNVLDWS